MSTMASQITSASIVCLTVLKKTPKLRVTGFCKGNPHKGPIQRKMFHLMTSPCRVHLPHRAWGPVREHCSTGRLHLDMIPGFLTLPSPRQNGRHFADDILKYIFMNEKSCILIKNSLFFLLRVQLAITQHWFYMMAWRRPGDEPLSEPILSRFIDAYIRHQGEMS